MMMHHTQCSLSSPFKKITKDFPNIKDYWLKDVTSLPDNAQGFQLQTNLLLMGESSEFLSEIKCCHLYSKWRGQNVGLLQLCLISMAPLKKREIVTSRSLRGSANQEKLCNKLTSNPRAPLISHCLQMVFVELIFFFQIYNSTSLLFKKVKQIKAFSDNANLIAT